MHIRDSWQKATSVQNSFVCYLKKYSAAQLQDLQFLCWCCLLWCHWRVSGNANWRPTGSHLSCLFETWVYSIWRQNSHKLVLWVIVRIPFCLISTDIRVDMSEGRRGNLVCGHLRVQIDILLFWLLLGPNQSNALSVFGPTRTAGICFYLFVLWFYDMFHSKEIDWARWSSQEGKEAEPSWRSPVLA